MQPNIIPSQQAIDSTQLKNTKITQRTKMANLAYIGISIVACIGMCIAVYTADPAGGYTGLDFFFYAYPFIVFPMIVVGYAVGVFDVIYLVKVRPTQRSRVLTIASLIVVFLAPIFWFVSPFLVPSLPYGLQ